MTEEAENGATQVMSLADIMPQLGGVRALLLMLDKGTIFRLPLAKESSIIGRAVESDIKLDFPDVSRKHCRVGRDSSGYILEDLGSSGGTFLTNEGLSEQQVKGKVKLSDHDIIRIGAHRFHFILTRDVTPEDFPQLVPVAGGPMVQLTGAVSTVGRANANVVVTDPRVSTKHAIIEVFGKGSVYVIDQGSANGTTVNDQKVTEPRRLDEHDVIGFAGIKYRVATGSTEAKTMIGVVSAPSSERPIVGTGTLRFDEDRKQVIEALASEKQNFMKTMALNAENTGVAKKSELDAIPGSRAATGTYTGPHPLAGQQPAIAPEPAAETGPAWLVQLRRRLKEPGGTMAVRIAGGVVLLVLLLYPYVLTVSGECRLTPGAAQKTRAPMQGRIERVLVVEGQHVNKGDPLLRFADRDLQYELKKTAAQRIETKNANEKERLAREMERLQAQLELTVVRAGIDGKVVTPAPQDLTNVVVSAGQELLEVDDTRRVVAEVLVPEGDIGDVAVGQKVYARLYTDTTETYESDVQTIMPVAEKGMLGSVVIVKAPLQNEDERLIPGTTGVAKIVGKRHMGIVLLFKKLGRIFK